MYISHAFAILRSNVLEAKIGQAGAAMVASVITTTKAAPRIPGRRTLGALLKALRAPPINQTTQTIGISTPATSLAVVKPCG